MRKQAVATIWISGLLGWLVVSWAQEPVIRVETDLVTIDVRVEGAGDTQKELTLSDFAVDEDGVRQQIVSFEASGGPLHLALLIDTSGSTREELTNLRRAAGQFFSMLRPQDRLALLQFHREVELLRDLTGDRPRLEAGLQLLRPGAGTSFYDALQLATEEVLGPVKGRKAILALTDGVDSVGYLHYPDILPLLERGGTTLYVLEVETERFTEAGLRRDCRDPAHFEFSDKQLRKYLSSAQLKGPPSHCRLPVEERVAINRVLYQMARQELRELTARTGGRVLRAGEVGVTSGRGPFAELAAAYQEIARELQTVYTLAYYPRNDRRDGGWRSLRVEVLRPGLTARTRPGYRAALR
jgi:Ca-activated chloride channel family protein